MLSDQINYETIPGARGEYFFCEKLSVKLSVESCIQSHKISRTEEAIHVGRRFHCRNCQTGMIHADEKRPDRCTGSMVCPRCRRWSRRLACGVCLSCYNRERELRIGVNAKGRPPVRLRQLHDIKLVVQRGDSIVTQSYRALDQHEALLRELRQNSGEITFGRAALASYKPRV